jgi:iron complex outermembrane receptor protein
MNNSLKLLSASAAAIMIASGGSAYAQVDEIIVTAQKKEENLQDVPIAVTALSGAEVDASASNNLEQLQQLVPALNFRKGTTTRNSALFLRGVGTISFSIAAEPSVSTVVDGTVLARSGQAFADLYDIERVEVLRGPQGTLFGKNASSGVVNIITKGGSDEFEGTLDVSLFEEEEIRTKLSLAGPLSETMSGRFTAFYGEYDGNITNIFNNEKANGYERYGARGVLDWEPTANANYRFILEYSEGDDNCCTEITGVSRGNPQDAELGFDNSRGDETRVINHNLTSKTLDENLGLSATGNWELASGHVVTGIASYRNSENTEIREGDFLPRPFVGQFELHDIGVQEFDQQSLELRIASPQDQQFTYQAGLYYFNAEGDRTFTREDVVCNTSTLPADPVTGAVPCDLTDTTNTSFPTATSNQTSEFDNFAIFGQGTYNVSDVFRVIAGLRFTNDEVSFTNVRIDGVDSVTGAPASGPGVRATGVNLSGSTDNTNLSGKLVGQYDINDDVTAYASYTRGYKGPAFNVFFNQTLDNVIDEETSDAFEAGLKTRLWDDKLILNLAAYFAEYDNFQANNFIVISGALTTNLTNAGTIETKGIEADFIAQPTPNWTLSGGVAFNDAEVAEFNPNPLTGAPNAQNGTQLPLAPEFSASIVSDYTMEFQRYNGHLRTSYSYKDDQFSGLGEAGPIDAYGLLDASIGISDKDDKYRLTFLAKNLTDESFVTLNTGNGTRLHIPREADRYFGVNFRANFR